MTLAISQSLKQKEKILKRIILLLTVPMFLATVVPRATADNANNPISFHGYGELHYNTTDKADTINEMDNHRLVLGWVYRYNETIRFTAEIDFEHAAKEMELEFAYIDYLIREEFNVRAGTMLMPVGYLNEYHEPPRFYSVERPYVQKYLIPTTWQEGGIGLFGSLSEGHIKYRAYVVSGLDASNFSASNGIRKGRGKVSESPSDNLALVGRMEYYGISGLGVGISGYTGNSGQGVDGITDAKVGLIETDVRYRIGGAELSALFTHITVGGTEKIFAATGNTVGETMAGGYMEAAYHFAPFLPREMDLVFFGRYERFDTQHSMAQGLNADTANDREVTTFGVSFMPINRVAVKADLELWHNDSGENWRQINLGLGYMY